MCFQNFERKRLRLVKEICCLMSSFWKTFFLIDIIVRLEFPSVHLLEFQLLLLQLCCSCLLEYFSVSFLFSPWNKHSCSRGKGENTLKILFSSHFWQHVCFQLVILFSSENSGAVGTWVNVFVFHCPLVDGIRTAELGQTPSGTIYFPLAEMSPASFLFFSKR